jgi:hypothetical protein
LAKIVEGHNAVVQNPSAGMTNSQLDRWTVILPSTACSAAKAKPVRCS